MEKHQLSTSPLLAGSPRSLAEEFVHSAVHSGIQSPVIGVCQIVDKLGVAEPILPSVQFMDQVAQTEFGSARWHAQQIGTVVGMALPFLLIHRSVAACTRPLVGRNSLANPNLLKGLVVAESTITGAIFDGMFRPSAPESPFVQARLSNAISGGATMFTLSGCAVGLKSLGQNRSGWIAGLVKNEIGSACLAGVPAGFVHAETSALFQGGRFATTREVTESVYSFAALGGVLATGNRAMTETGAKRNTTNPSVVRCTDKGAGVNLSMGELNGVRNQSEAAQLHTRERLLEQRIDLETKLGQLENQLSKLDLMKESQFAEVMDIATGLLQYSLLREQNKTDTIRSLKESLSSLKRSQNDGGTGSGSSVRALEIALEHERGWVPQTDGSPFFIRSPRYGCSVPLRVVGKVPAKLGFDVIDHTVTSIMRPSLLKLISDSKATFRGRANSLYEGHVILNFNDSESRVPVYDHELGHVVKELVIETDPNKSSIVQNAYAADVENSSLERVVKDVLQQVDYVHPRIELAEPVELVIPESMRRRAYHSSKSEVIAESYKLFLQSKSAAVAGIAPLTFAELVNAHVTNTRRKQAMIGFEATYAALQQHIFDPLYMEEMAKRTQSPKP